jgi:hypothetical protein
MLAKQALERSSRQAGHVNGKRSVRATGERVSFPGHPAGE